MRFDFFHDGRGRTGCYVRGLWVQTGKKMLQATGCRAGRNWATRSEEAPGPAGTGRDKELTVRIKAAIQPHLPSPERAPAAWVMAELGFGFRSLDSQPPDRIVAGGPLRSAVGSGHWRVRGEQPTQGHWLQRVVRGS